MRVHRALGQGGGVSVVLTIPAPGKWIASNQRGHWQRHELTTLWRDAATVHARQARAKVASPFALHAVIHKRDRRLFDLDGVVPTIKAAVDGCRRAGLIEDDNWRHMVRLTVEAGDPDPAPYLQLRFTEET